MPSKSRHNQRKKTFKTPEKKAPVAAVSAESAPAAAAIYKPAAAAQPLSPAGKTSTAGVMRYPYFKKEIMWTGILAAIILIVMLILYFSHIV